MKVINYYCLLDFSRRPEKFFYFFLNTITSTRTGTQSQAQAEIQSQAQAEAQAAAAQLPGSGLNSNNLLRIKAWCQAHQVIKYDPFFIDWMQLPCYIKSYIERTRR